jgi:hypothetical protein
MRFHTKTLFKKSGYLLAGLLLMMVVMVGGQAKMQSVAAAEIPAQMFFTTPEEAGRALEAAAAAGDEKALAQILGPESKAILNSGDAEEDQAALASFAKKYERMNRWVTMTDGSRVLYIGADNYAYPIPLAQNASSKWCFNTAAGKGEILARRIGKNELLAIDAISAMARAEEHYYKHHHDGDKTHQYAQLILSSPGKQDGLYWEVPEDAPSSSLGRLNEFASDVITSTQPGAAPVFDGYSFRVLTAQGDDAKGGAKSYLANGKMTGGFAILASPVTYGDSGIMTFIVSREGVVYQKDLGVATAAQVSSINSYNPADGWSQAE